MPLIQKTQQFGFLMLVFMSLGSCISIFSSLLGFEVFSNTTLPWSLRASLNMDFSKFMLSVALILLASTACYFYNFKYKYVSFFGTIGAGKRFWIALMLFSLWSYTPILKGITILSNRISNGDFANSLFTWSTNQDYRDSISYIFKVNSIVLYITGALTILLLIYGIYMSINRIRQIGK
jgi:hypothetical protein